MAKRSSLQKWTFLVLFVLAAYGFWRTLEPVWVPLLLGAVIAVGVYPLHEKLLGKFGGRQAGLSAALLTGAVMVLSLGLLAFLIFVVGHRVVVFAQQLSARYEHNGAVGLLGTDLSRQLGRLGLSADDVQQRFVDAVRDVAAFLGKGATSIVAGFFSAIFIFIFTALTGVASILPAVGTALVWVPVGIVLMLTGHIGKGLGVLVWGGVVVVFVADYVLRPKLIARRSR